MIAKVSETFASLHFVNTITIPATTAGNTLVLMGAFAANNTGHNVTGVSGGGTWTRSTADVAGGNFWTCPNCSAGVTSLTLTFDNNYAVYDVNVTEWSGMPTTLTVDGGGNQNASRPNDNTPSVTPTAGSPVLIIGYALPDPGHAIAGPSNGFTALSYSGGTGTNIGAYLIVTSASGSYSTGWTDVSGYGICFTGIIAFDGTSGGGASSGLLNRRRRMARAAA